MKEATQKAICRALNLDPDLAFKTALEEKIWECIDTANGCDEMTEDEYLEKHYDLPYSYETGKIIAFLEDHPRTTEAGLIKAIKRLNKNEVKK